MSHCPCFERGFPWKLQYYKPIIFLTGTQQGYLRKTGTTIKEQSFLVKTQMKLGNTFYEAHVYDAL